MFSKFRTSHFVIFLAVLITITGAFIGYKTWSNKQPYQSSATSDILQFVSSGHVLGFQKTGVYVATGSHVLRESFANTDGVLPQSDTPSTSKGKAPIMGKVTYPNLWNGITLVYDSPPGGIIRSTFQVEPGADPNQIALKYNVPVSLDNTGNIVYTFEKGELIASAPVAWQEIDGKRVPVRVAFRMDNSQETVHFNVAEYNTDFDLFIDPTLKWNTFVTVTGNDKAFDIAVDQNGNICLAGNNGFVAKLNSSGETIWKTQLGALGYPDGINGITVDNIGDIYVTGYSDGTWGDPVNAHSGDRDAFAAKLNSSGQTIWNTFLGTAGQDVGNSIALDDNANIYITGSSVETWGNPKNEHSTDGSGDIFVAKLTGSGETVVWNTFLGGSYEDQGKSIALDNDENIYVAGFNEFLVPPPTDDLDVNIYVAKLNSSGETVWNTSFGSHAQDEGWSIALDDNGNVYITGYSWASWGNPINDFSGTCCSGEAFVVKINSSGETIWNTFMGSEDSDHGYGITIDKKGNAYVVGMSLLSWGNPIIPFSDATEAFVAKLNTNGIRQWNTFMGSEYDDIGTAIAVYEKGVIYVAGYSDSSWGSPINNHEGDFSWDAFAAKIMDRSPSPSVPVLILNSSE